MPTAFAPGMLRGLMLEDSCQREDRGLGPRSLVIVRAVAEALMSDAREHGRPTAPPLELVNRIVDDLDLMIGAGSPDLRRGFAALCMMIERLPPVVLGTMCKMTKLTLSERVAYLEALEGSQFGLLATIAVAIKLPLLMIAYETGDELAMTGFDRPSLQVTRDDVPLPVPRSWNGQVSP